MKSVPLYLVAKYNVLMQSCPENAILCHNKTIIGTSKSFLKLINYSLEECIGASWEEFVEFQIETNGFSTSSTSDSKDYLIILNTKEGKKPYYVKFGHLSTQDNLTFWYFKPALSDNVKFIINERKKSIQKTNILKVLNQISQKFNTLVELEPILETITQEIVNLLDVDRSSIILNQDNKFIVKITYDNETQGHFIRDIPIDIKKYPEIQDALTNQKIVVIKDITDYLNFYPFEDQLHDLDIKSILVIPIIYREEIKGCLHLRVKGNLRHFTQEEIKLCQTLSAQAAIVIERANLYKQLQKNNEILESKVQERTQELQKLHYQILRQKKELRDIFDGITSAIYIMDKNRNVINANKKALKLAKCSSIKQLSNQNCYKVFHNRNKPCEDCLVLYVFNTGQVISREYDDLFNKKGEKIYIKTTYSPIKNEEKKVIQVIALAEDVTLLKELQNKLVETERLAILGEMAAYVAHEVRNPLNTIEGSVVYLKSVHPEDENIEKYVGIIQKQIRRMSRWTSDLLNFSKPLISQLQLLDLNQIINNVCETLSEDSQFKQTSLHLNLAQNLPHLKLDRLLIEQVLWNLLQNAMQFSDKKCKIYISTSFSKKNKQIELKIKDNGIGIPEENLPHIFKAFYTTRAKGNGLGLSIIKRIIKLHNANITVDSKVGQGTTFTITFPVPIK